jgi:hypothetical protein
VKVSLTILYDDERLCKEYSFHQFVNLTLDIKVSVLFGYDAMSAGTWISMFWRSATQGHIEAAFLDCLTLTMANYAAVKLH